MDYGFMVYTTAGDYVLITKIKKEVYELVGAGFPNPPFLSIDEGAFESWTGQIIVVVVRLKDGLFSKGIVLGACLLEQGGENTWFDSLGVK